MKKDGKIYIAGHRGMVGSALVRELNTQGYNNTYPAEFIYDNLMIEANVIHTSYVNKDD